MPAKKATATAKAVKTKPAAPEAKAPAKPVKPPKEVNLTQAIAGAAIAGTVLHGIGWL